MIGGVFLWLGLSIVVAVGANTRGRNPSAWFFYAVFLSPLIAGLLLLALPNLSSGVGRIYLEGELEEIRRRRAIAARIVAALFVILLIAIAFLGK
jgi:hypothetical protein